MKTWLAHHRVRGFTLIELLVVIAVISILASLLLPALSSAKKAAYAAKCKGNLHQISLALSMYVQDHQSYPPFLYPGVKYLPGGGVQSIAYNWPDSLEPYLSSKWGDPVFRCPAYKGPTTIPKAVVSWAHFYNFGSYGYNARNESFSLFPNPRAGTIGMVYLQESEVKEPSDMIALGDGNLFPIYGAEARDQVILSGVIQDGAFASKGILDKNPLKIFSEEERSASRRAVRDRHKDRYNVAFCDGHIEFLKHDKLYEKSETALRRWNRNHEPVP